MKNSKKINKYKKKFLILILNLIYNNFLISRRWFSSKGKAILGKKFESIKIRYLYKLFLIWVRFFKFYIVSLQNKLKLFCINK